MILEIKSLKKTYENVEPLKGINAVVNQNDVISIIGPSGTGKSTLLRCINRLEDATSGEVIFNGRNIYDKDYSISKARREIGMIFQSFNLFNNLSVIENLMAAPISILHKTKSEAYDIAVGLLDRFSLKERMNNYPHELSGGQRQRVAIMRAIAMQPSILLFDEPTSALDPVMVGEVVSIINDLKVKGLTMMIVTHEMSFARKVSNRVFYLDEGIIYEEGSPEDIFDHPQKAKTKDFIYRIDSFEKEVDKENFDFYLFISDFMRYMASKQLSMSEVNMINLLVEETTFNEIFPNLKNDRKLKIRIQIIAGELIITYTNLNDFNYNLTNSDKFSSSIINNSIIEKKADVVAKTIIYRFKI